ncbi:MAG: hypothetical protein GY909_02040 [Oligoflexia bacterium]|nr:hypothetical protein [Oligoflexia bacterium]
MNICIYDIDGNFETVGDFLKSLGRSKSFLKKNLDKKFLNKQARHKDELSISLNILNDRIINNEYKGESISVIHEDENILALSKPHQIHCHPLSYEESDNCLSYLKSQSKFQSLNVNKDQYDRGLLFRLDYETSGVLLLAKNEESYSDIRENYHQRVVQKMYLAIVDDKIDERGTLKHFISTSGKRIKADVSGVEAIIEYEKIASLEGLALIRIKLGHGHRHQIRVQLQLNKTPILGDQLYDGEKDERLWLHACEYHLKTDSNEVLIIKDYPDLFRNFLDLNSHF